MTKQQHEINFLLGLLSKLNLMQNMILCGPVSNNCEFYRQVNEVMNNICDRLDAIEKGK